MKVSELLESYVKGERNFQGVDLRCANFSAADLRAADLSNADLREAKYSFGTEGLLEAIGLVMEDRDESK